MNHGGDVHVLASLRPYLDGHGAEAARSGFRLVFDDPADLAAAAERAAAAVLPAMAPVETGLLRSLRAGHFLLPIVGVVCDRTGHQTYLALCAGATTVLNLLLAEPYRMEALHAALARGPARFADDSRPAAEFPWARRVALMGSRRATASAPRDTELLVDMLCGPQTVSAIARHFFCSERSMYRRIRHLYDEFGVTGRAGLRMAVAARSADVARGA